MTIAGRLLLRTMIRPKQCFKKLGRRTSEWVGEDIMILNLGGINM